MKKLRISLTVAAITILMFLLLQIPIKAFSQSVGVGTGYATGYNNNQVADIPFKISLNDIHRFGIYFKFMNDNFAYSTSGTYVFNDEHSEIVTGLSYKVYSEQTDKVIAVHSVFVTSGIGFTETRCFYRTSIRASDMHLNRIKGKSFEVGSCINFIKLDRFTISTDFGLNSFSGFYTLISANINIVK